MPEISFQQFNSRLESQFLLSIFQCNALYITYYLIISYFTHVKTITSHSRVMSLLITFFQYHIRHMKVHLQFSLQNKILLLCILKTLAKQHVEIHYCELQNLQHAYLQHSSSLFGIDYYKVKDYDYSKYHCKRHLMKIPKAFKRILFTYYEISTMSNVQ